MTEQHVPRPEFVDRAEAEKFKSEARKAAAEAVKTEAEAAYAEIALEKARIDFAELHADNKFHHVYRFDTDVNGSSVKQCMSRIDVWRRLEPGCEIRIIFTSPGGSVVDGLALWDYLQQVRRDGHKVLTHTEGMAASMAGILLQAGDVRTMGQEAYLLIHEVQAGMMGSFGDLEDRMKWLEKVQERILDIFATRASEVTGKSFAVTRKIFEKNWRRKDWWIDSKEALQLGLVDEVT
jgi:ATP-dependent protease ClpP protease subunit